MTLDELRAKDVINTRDGRSLGRVMDIEFCLCDGKITAIIVPDGLRPTSCFTHLFKGEKKVVIIPWDMICKIGDDVILVDVEVV